MDARDWPALGRPGDVLRRRAPRSEVKGDGSCGHCVLGVRAPWRGGLRRAHSVWVREREPPGCCLQMQVFVSCRKAYAFPGLGSVGVCVRKRRV